LNAKEKCSKGFKQEKKDMIPPRSPMAPPDTRGSVVFGLFVHPQNRKKGKADFKAPPRVVLHVWGLCFQTKLREMPPLMPHEKFKLETLLFLCEENQPFSRGLGVFFTGSNRQGPNF